MYINIMYIYNNVVNEKMKVSQDQLYKYITEHDVKLSRLAELMGISSLLLRLISATFPIGTVTHALLVLIILRSLTMQYVVFHKIYVLAFCILVQTKCTPTSTAGLMIRV